MGLNDPRVFPVPCAKAIRRALLRWYDRRRRDLPWRRDAPDPYATLVSEFMLQQTQVATVIPYFERFMARFPTVRALAAADLDDVLPYWAGLGYYRRCHHLHAAARMVVHDRDGDFPRCADELAALPGVGRYAAGAIASIAFGERTPAIDGNARRVLDRVVGMAPVSDSGFGTGRADRSSQRVVSRKRRASAGAGSDEARRQAAAELVPRGRPGDFNQALMELGATVCVPKRPACQTCPINPCCRTFVEGRSTTVTRARRPIVAQETVVTLAVCVNGWVLLQKRPDLGLWAGLWELPGVSPKGKETPARASIRLLRSLAGAGRERPAPYTSLVHRLTHRRFVFRAYRAALTSRRAVYEAERATRWIRISAALSVAVSAVTARLIAALGEACHR